MRLAFILHHYFPHGGLQRDAVRIAAACREQGHEIEFLTMHWQGPALQNIAIKFFPQRHFLNYHRAKAFSSAVKEYIQHHHYDGIVGFNKMPGLDIYYAADPCFVANLKKNKFNRIYKFLPRYRHNLKEEVPVASVESNTHIFLISPQAKIDFKNYYHTPEQRLHYLSPGIASDRCWEANAPVRRENMRKKLGINPEKKLVLILGSAFKTKGVDRGIHAVAALPTELRNDTELLIVGKGEEKPFWRLAKQLKIEKQIHFLPGSDEVPELLLAADLLLHPAYVENTGTVILEAIVAGLPVLTTANCGYAFYVQQAQAGLVSPEPFSQDRLNKQLSYMLTAKEYKEWQRNAIQFGKQQDLYSMPEKAAALITEIVKKKLENKFTFKDLMQQEGKVYRQIKQRKTIRFLHNGQYYFAKLFWGVSVGEFIKNIFQARWPVIDASLENRALITLANAGIDVPKVIAYESHGVNPLKRQSFIVMQAIEPSISLEEYLQQWQAKPLSVRRALIIRVAQIARNIHAQGFQHRDFYACHFLLKTPEGEKNVTADNFELAVIDWHRARFKKTLPQQWIIKDLAALYFSVLSAPLTRRDYLRFLKIYTQKPLREILPDKNWKKIEKKALGLYQKFFYTLPAIYKKTAN